MSMQASDPSSRFNLSGKQAASQSRHDYPLGENLHVRHSKDLFARMEARVNLQALGSYIRDGGTRELFLHKPFYERIAEADQRLGERRPPDF